MFWGLRLDGLVCLITGAGRGLGARSAEILADAGGRIVVTDIEDSRGEAVAGGIRRSGKEASFYHLDVRDEQQWLSVIEKTVSSFGGLDVVVNNAGIEAVGAIENLSMEEWRRVLAVNLDGVFLGTKHAIRAMKPGGIAGRGGSIINLSSVAGLVGFYGIAAYCASKGAVRILTKVAAIECGKLHYGIRVNSVHPGSIESEMVEECLADLLRSSMIRSLDEGRAQYASMNPIGRMGDPHDVAQAVLFLASDASAFVTGSELLVDGGMTAQ